MFCNQCGADIKEGFKFCAKCGAPIATVQAPVAAPTAKGKAVKGKKAAAQPVQAAPPAPVTAPAPVAVATPVVAPAGPKPDVKNIVRKPLVVVSLLETLDFAAAEKELEGGLKCKAFSGFFSSAQPSEVRVDSLVKFYEPVHMVRAAYEGTFEVMKDFNLNLDPGTVKLSLDNKVYDIKEIASGGAFGGSSSNLKLTGMETVNKRVDKAVCYDMNGVQKNQIEIYVKGKQTLPFNTSKQMARTTVLGTNFSAANLTDKVMTPDIVQRVNNAKRLVEEKITVDIQTIYYPKYKAQVTSLKNQQSKYLVFSAVDKQVFSTELF